MPHINLVEVDGVRFPSVNEISDSLSKEGLIRNFYRPLGFKKADAITEVARNRGIEIGAMFEDILTGEKVVRHKKTYPDFFKAFGEWAKSLKRVQAVECHLIDFVDQYHGSPDLVADFGDGLEMVDYKVKERHADYRIMMNEAAYINAWEHMYGDVIKKIRIVTFHPKTAKVYEEVRELNHKWLQDFFVCFEQWKVNATANDWFNEHCRTKLKP